MNNIYPVKDISQSKCDRTLKKVEKYMAVILEKYPVAKNTIKWEAKLFRYEHRNAAIIMIVGHTIDNKYLPYAGYESRVNITNTSSKVIEAVIRGIATNIILASPRTEK